jgi:hypothetical protein
MSCGPAVDSVSGDEQRLGSPVVLGKVKLGVPFKPFEPSVGRPRLSNECKRVSCSRLAEQGMIAGKC